MKMICFSLDRSVICSFSVELLREAWVCWEKRERRNLEPKPEVKGERSKYKTLFTYTTYVRTVANFGTYTMSDGS